MRAPAQMEQRADREEQRRSGRGGENGEKGVEKKGQEEGVEEEEGFSHDPHESITAAGSHLLRLAQVFRPLAGSIDEFLPPGLLQERRDVMRRAVARACRMSVPRGGVREWLATCSDLQGRYQPQVSETEKSACDLLSRLDTQREQGLPPSSSSMAEGDGSKEEEKSKEKATDHGDSSSLAEYGRAACSVWLSSIARAASAHLLNIYLSLPRVEQETILQISTDTLYLETVLRALSLSPEPLLARLRSLLCISPLK